MFGAVFSKLPNWLTLFRVLVVPFVVLVYYLPNDWLSMPEKNLTATIMFLVAGLTDWLDGWVARHFSLGSAFGEFLDPVADKLLVCSTLIALVHLGRLHALVALVIIGREITISALREWMASIRQHVRVSQLGKYKTTFQFLGIGFLLYSGDFLGIRATIIVNIGQWLIAIAVVLTIVSMFDYLIKSAKILRGNDSAK